ncbi:hypothetical protein AB0M02_26710 [Actinoplanes sp. NPDC051861]|uniref:DUF7779 domain-containing protein n=1 Tax=Actinoplanes sp. NPDC051861 TaxID=3155170 RepID=UPI00344615D4
MMIGDHNVLHLHQPQPAPARPVWRIPFPVDPEFIGRDTEMAALIEALEPGSRTVVNQTISGLGGIGKTQLAAHAAHAVADRFRIVWWIEAEHRTTIEASLQELGKALDFGKNPSTTEVLARLSSFEDAAEWLLIYDNAESPQSLRGLLPTRGSGVVLITTRYHDWPAWAPVFRLGPLSDEAAAQVLTKGSPSQAAQRIAEMFGCLPLALRQAAAQIEAGLPLETYEQMLRSRFVEAVGSAEPLPDYNHSVVDVVVLASSAAAAVEPESARLLLLLALLDPDRVDDGLLRHVPASDPLADPLVLARSIAALKRFSLVTEVEGATRAYAMHRLTQEVVRRTVGSDHAEVAETALRALNRTIGAESIPARAAVPAVAHLRNFIAVARRDHPQATVRLLTAVASRTIPERGALSSIVWAARTALDIVETDRSFSDSDLLSALMCVHRAEKRMSAIGSPMDTTPIRRAMAMELRREPEGSAALATLQLELAGTIAPQPRWRRPRPVVSRDALTEALELTRSAIGQWGDEEGRDAVQEARLLHASITGRLGQVDEALAEYSGAIASAENDGTLWRHRVTIAEEILAFGRIATARTVVQPWIAQPVSDGGFSAFLQRQIDDVYFACAAGRLDWAECLKVAESRRSSRMESFTFREDFASLRLMRTAFAGLERWAEVEKIDERLAREPGRRTLEMLHEERLQWEQRDTPFARELVTLLLLQEAQALTAVDWDSAVATFDRARSLVDGDAVTFHQLAEACLVMASKARPHSPEYVDECLDILARHPEGAPSLMSRAAELYVEIAGDYATAAKLEFSAAALEEQAHGRVFPTVAEHLSNAVRYSSGDHVDLLEEILEIAAVCVGEECPRWAGYAVDLAEALTTTDPARARDLLERAHRILSGAYGPGHSATKRAYRPEEA